MRPQWAKRFEINYLSAFVNVVQDSDGMLTFLCRKLGITAYTPRKNAILIFCPCAENEMKIWYIIQEILAILCLSNFEISVT